MLSQGLRYVVHFKAELLGLHHELLQLVLEQVAALRRRGRGTLRYHRPDARTDFDQPLGYQVSDHLVGRVRVDLKRLTQGTHGWECIAGPHLPGHNRLLGGVHYLLVKRDARLKRQSEWDHTCTITASTVQGN